MSDAIRRPAGSTPWDDGARTSGGDRQESGSDGGTVRRGPAGVDAPTESGARHLPAGVDGPVGSRDQPPPAEIEDAVPLTARVRAVLERGFGAARSSIPVRTILFVLPPLVLPALAFGLSLGAALAVTVLLLWLAMAAGVVATLMLEGTDLLALRTIDRRIDQLATHRDADDEALLAVGAQLDALSDRLDELLATARRPAVDLAVEHRPQEQWPPVPDVHQNDGHDNDVDRGRHWSPTRWQR